jgi:tetratricopeptide (TPR) repeat protein
MRNLGLLILSGLFMSCQPVPDLPFEHHAASGTLQAVSLNGDSLVAEPLGDMIALDADLDNAITQYETDPTADNLIWVGRRLGYLWRYQDAIAVFSQGISRYPDDPRFLRHRGHRYISVRRFEEAESDLERAAELIEGKPDEIEPDGAPNAANIPVSTLHFNIWYHLGLAHYLLGDFESAFEAYQACMAASDNNDSRVATADWMYMTLRRLGRDAEAEEVLQPISSELDLLENHSYLRRILMYKREISSDSLLNSVEATPLDLATQGYGVGNWKLVEGDTAGARSIFKQVVAGDYWPAFGFIAAETDLHRLRAAQRNSPGQ